MMPDLRFVMPDLRFVMPDLCFVMPDLIGHLLPDPESLIF